MKRAYVLEVLYVDGFNEQFYLYDITHEEMEEFKEQVYQYILDGFGVIEVKEEQLTTYINVAKVLRVSVRPE